MLDLGKPLRTLASLEKWLPRSAPPTEPPPLLEFVPRLSKHYASPRHLAPLASALERPEELRLVVATPPRHGKTETILHAIAWHLARDPARTLGYVTYGAALSRSKSLKARTLAERAGVALVSSNLDEWRTTAGGGLLATGVGGPLTGQGLDLLIVDDPIKNRQEAESPLVRERLWEWFNDVAFTRLEPGAGAVVVATRWHPDDLSGRLLEQGWRYLKLPALGDAPLWPERWPREALERIRAQVGEYSWASLYQGEPRSKGGAVFRDAWYYDALPDGGYREGAGVDFAYTAKTYADYSVLLQGRLYGDTLYLTDCFRDQLEPRLFAGVLRGKRPCAFVAGTEKGVVAFCRSHGIDLDARPAVGDKHARAQPVAAAWNAGRVLLPRSAPWLRAFLDEVLGFTGVADRHDDQVDALAALWASFDSRVNVFA